jgi:hypothetical protein
MDYSSEFISMHINEFFAFKIQLLPLTHKSHKNMAHISVYEFVIKSVTRSLPSGLYIIVFSDPHKQAAHECELFFHVQIFSFSLTCYMHNVHSVNARLRWTVLHLPISAGWTSSAS